MKKSLYVILAMLFVALYAAPSWAEIDYRCLGLCRNNGGSPQDCMAQCEYDQPSSVIGTSKPNASVGGAHKVFNAPIPSEETILPTHRAAAPEASKDYHCVAECLRNGGQYQLCNDRCTRTNCAPGSTMCKDLRGFAPEHALQGSETVPLATVLPGVSIGTTIYQPH